MKPFKRFFGNEAGNATEYSLIVALISIVIAAGAQVLGSGLINLYTALFHSLPAK